jgi:hypothetical protein
MAGLGFLVAELKAGLTSSSLYSNRAGMHKRLTELGFMAGAYDARKCLTSYDQSFG